MRIRYLLPCLAVLRRLVLTSYVACAAMADEEYISVEEVAAIMGLSIRQASRYASKVRTERINQRVLFHRGDVMEQARLKGIEQEARERAATYQPKPQKTDLVPAGEMLEYIRERDRQLAEVQERLQSQLNQALLEIGRLQGQLQETQQVRQLLADVQAERDELRKAIRRAQPFWRRWFGRDEPSHDD